VTITGADDEVDPERLAEFSKDFPFVEWGILFSPKHEGTPRYPSQKWVRKLEAVAAKTPEMTLSAHLCGAAMRAVTTGKIEALSSIYAMITPIKPSRPMAGSWTPARMLWKRIQLNGFDAFTPEGSYALQILHAFSPFEYIVQWPRRDAAMVELGALPRVSVLYDPSGGRGESPKDWPAAVPGAKHGRMGYAGGITPTNVRSAIERITSVAGESFWIDMESGVREDDRFDLTHVNTVLKIVAEKRRELYDLYLRRMGETHHQWSKLPFVLLETAQAYALFLKLADKLGAIGSSGRHDDIQRLDDDLQNMGFPVKPRCQSTDRERARHDSAVRKSRGKSA